MDLYASLVAVGIGSIRNGIGMYGSILKFYTVSYALHIILGDIMVGPYVIDLLLDKFRMCQLGCEISVISEKKHTGRVAVKTPYRIYTLVASTLYKIHDCESAIWIIACGYTVLRLVEKYVALLLKSDHLLIVLYHIAMADLSAEFGNDLSIDLYKPLKDKFVCFTA